ncbi:MAG: acyltransferase [Paludibacteraceae bacterium]
MNNNIYIPGLNGLRSVAALSVLACHLLYMNIGERFIVDWSIAHYAVTMFFVISGFLITYLLLQEKTKKGNVDIPKFYFRRILRIWPIYFIYIIFSAITMAIDGQFKEFRTTSLFCFLFISGNFISFFSDKGPKLIEHFWSIGVEEQFYLFWPWSVKIGHNAKKISIFTLFCIFIYIGIKLIIYKLIGPESSIYQFVKQTRFDCMLIGALGAFIYHKRHTLLLKILSNKMLQLISWSFYFLQGFNLIYFPIFFAHEAVAIATLVLVIGQIHNPLLSLELPVFNFLGKISYGVYVIHPLVLYVSAKFFLHFHINIWLKWALFSLIVTFFTILIAWLSYTYFESFFLKF